MRKVAAVLTEQLQGLVIRTQSGFFTVQTPDGPIVCQLRGRLKEEYQETDLVAIGDRVTLERLTIEADNNVTGAIVAVDERQRVLSRVAPRSAVGTSAEREQVIIANPDQAIFVFAAARPDPHVRMLDRFLVAAEKAAIPAIRVCVNKIDLAADLAKTRQIFGLYEQIGYPVLYVSAKTGEGLAALQEALAGKISVFTGPSGVGKTSLLNAIEPDLGRRVSEISRITTKGRHTTRYSELVPCAGGYIADTPGIRALSPWDVEPHELDGYYIEIAQHVADCKFQDCTHTHEPGCGVQAAMQRGAISPERYDSYLRLRQELEEQYIY
jgi:ribosome biogenesis GTPase